MSRRTNKAKISIETRNYASHERIVGLLVKAAEAQDDLATTYREMGWDCAAGTAESEAEEFRRRAEYFKSV